MHTCIHVGYPRTGTTLLQRQIFAADTRLNYLGKPWPDPFLDEFEKKVLTADDLQFASEGKRFGNEFSERLAPSKLNVMSHEGFVRATRYHLPNGQDVRRTMKRLADVFSIVGDVSFLLVLRRHRDLLWSNYNTFRGGLARYGFGWSEMQKVLRNESSDDRFILDNFKFFETYGFLADVAGPDNVKVLCYESLAEDPEKFLSEIYDFLKLDTTAELRKRVGERVNASSTKTSAFRLRRWLGLLPPALKTPPSRWREDGSPMAKWLSETRRIARQTKLDRTQPSLDKSVFAEHDTLIKSYFRADLENFADSPIYPDLQRHGYL